MAPSTHLHLSRNNNKPAFHKGGALPWPDERTVQTYTDLGVAQLRRLQQSASSLPYFTHISFSYLVETRAVNNLSNLFV